MPHCCRGVPVKRARVRGSRREFFLLAGLVIFLLGCIPTVKPVRPVSEVIGAEPWKQLGRLQSFSFRLWYRTDVPFSIIARYTGVRDSSDREAWDGFYLRDGERKAVHLRAKGAIQFFLTDSGWQAQPRGLETRILVQLEQLLRDVQFNYIGEADGKLIFQFIPNMTLIDPLRVKVLTGQLEIERGSGLPVRIYCRDWQRTAEWEVGFYRFNRSKRVALPFVPASRFWLTVNKPFNCAVKRKLATALARRFQQFGADFRFQWRGRRLQVMLDQALPGSAIELLVSRGRVELWRGRWATEAELGTAGVLPVGIDAAHQVVLEELLGANGTLSVAIDTTMPEQPKLLVRGSFQPEGNHRYILLIDGRVLGTTTRFETGQQQAESEPRETATLIFSDIGRLEVLRAIVTLLNTALLSPDLVLVLNR